MTDLIRFGISLEKELSKKFDKRIQREGYTNRSEAIRDLIRHDLVEQAWQEGSEIAGAVTLIYNHHKRELMNTITDIQHDFQKVIISSQHVHLDHDNCLEIIAVKGSPQEVLKLADLLKAVKGVKHGTLSMSATGKNLS
ncbi:MAG: nickel-responsive transcriptional regulator NikR [Candidatus Omnitrophica bacterium]|nr:nickel-responsive transcriptional regulator NikR [Candidatus Omnitrophota bacterium]